MVGGVSRPPRIIVWFSAIIAVAGTGMLALLICSGQQSRQTGAWRALPTICRQDDCHGQPSRRSLIERFVLERN